MATFYFNAAVDNDWTTLGNWWQDSAFSVPATVLPTSSDDVIATAAISSNSGSEPTIINFTLSNSAYFQISITVTGLCTFNDSSLNFGTITGDATLNDLALNFGTVSGTLTNNTGKTYYYFNAAVDNDWQSLGNWWMDRACTTPAVSLPGSDANVVILANSSGSGVNGILANSGSVPTVSGIYVKEHPGETYISTEISVTNLAVFDGGNSYLYTETPEDAHAVINGNCLFFNGSSIYYENDFFDAVVNGNCVFYENSYNYGGTVTGNATFNDNSFNNYGTVTGDATFNDSTNNNNYGTVTGDAVFNDSSYNYGTVTGDAVFNDSSSNTNGTVTGDAVFNDSSYNYGGTVTGNATFNDNSFNNYGTVTGDAVFNDSSYNNSGGTVTGDAVFNDGSFNNINSTVAGDAVFNDGSFNNGTVTGDAVFNDSSYNAGTVTGNATFSDGSYNGGLVSGDATFTGSSYNASSGSVGGTESYSDRTPYPIPRGINGSSILGIV